MIVHILFSLSLDFISDAMDQSQNCWKKSCISRIMLQRKDNGNSIPLADFFVLIFDNKLNKI